MKLRMMPRKRNSYQIVLMIMRMMKSIISIRPTLIYQRQVHQIPNYPTKNEIISYQIIVFGHILPFVFIIFILVNIIFFYDRFFLPLPLLQEDIDDAIEGNNDECLKDTKSLPILHQSSTNNNEEEAGDEEDNNYSKFPPKFLLIKGADQFLQNDTANCV